MSLPGKILRNSNLMFEIRYFPKSLFLTYHARHPIACPNLLMLPQKLKLIDFSSLQNFYIELAVHFGRFVRAPRTQPSEQLLTSITYGVFSKYQKDDYVEGAITWSCFE